MKTKHILKLFVGVLLLQALSSSCDDGDTSNEDKDNPDTGVKESISRSDYKGRGTEACQDWQFAHCKYVYETCDFSMQGDMAGCLD